MTKHDGGPAFAHYMVKPISNTAHGQFHGGGMSLRDWFAGQALAAFVANSEFECASRELLARWAYQHADAMLAERNRVEDTDTDR